MSEQRRNFSATFKSNLVIELLKSDRYLNTLAFENNIQPNLLRNWKKYVDQTTRVNLARDLLKTKELPAVVCAVKSESMSLSPS